MIRAIDGPLAPLPCVSETAYRRCTECQDENRCKTRFVMKQVRDAISGVLDEITLSDLMKRPDEEAARAATFEIMTRNQFLLSFGLSSAALAAGSKSLRGGLKVLLTVAHPDDEYTFAATVYRIAKELQGTVDQVVITNGEAGYRYSSLAEQYYRASLTTESVGRALLPEIRRRETLAAGKVLGIRRHHF